MGGGGAGKNAHHDARECASTDLGGRPAQELLCDDAEPGIPRTTFADGVAQAEKRRGVGRRAGRRNCFAIHRRQRRGRQELLQRGFGGRAAAVENSPHPHGARCGRRSRRQEAHDGTQEGVIVATGPHTAPSSSAAARRRASKPHERDEAEHLDWRPRADQGRAEQSRAEQKRKEENVSRVTGHCHRQGVQCNEKGGPIPSFCTIPSILFIRHLNSSKDSIEDANLSYSR